MTAGYGGETGTRPSGRSANEVGSAVLAAAGCVFLLLGTFLPYVRYSGGEDYAVFDVDHLGTTWAGGLSYLIAVAAVPFVWILAFRRPRVLGAFLVGVGLVVTFDFIGAFVIAPTTYEGSADLRLGGVLGTIGGALLVAAGLTALLSSASGEQADAAAPRPTMADEKRRPPRTVGVFLLAAVAVNATLGVIAILFGDFGEPDNLAVKTVGSSLSITAGILVALACVPALRGIALRPVPLGGMVLSAAGFGTLLAGVWGQWGSEEFWKIATTLAIAALACAWASLLAQVQLPALHPLRVGSLVAVLAFGVASIAAVWALTTSGEFWRMYGTIGVIVAGLTTAAIVVGGSNRSAPAL